MYVGTIGAREATRNNFSQSGSENPENPNSHKQLDPDGFSHPVGDALARTLEAAKEAYEKRPDRWEADDKPLPDTKPPPGKKRQPSTSEATFPNPRTLAGRAGFPMDSLPEGAREILFMLHRACIRKRGNYLPSTPFPFLPSRMAKNGKKHTPRWYRKCCSQLVEIGLVREVGKGAHGARLIWPAWANPEETMRVWREAAKRFPVPPEFPLSSALVPPGVPSGVPPEESDNEKPTKELSPISEETGPGDVLTSYLLTSNKPRETRVSLANRQEMREPSVFSKPHQKGKRKSDPPPREREKPWQSGLKRPQCSPQEKWDAFVELVREASKLTPKPQSLYRTAQVQLNSYAVDDLLPGWREAVGGYLTGEVKFILSYLRKRYPVEGVPPWERNHEA